MMPALAAPPTLAAWRHWLALWLGWLAMGQLGSAMAWSWSSGLAGVAAWWCWMQWAPMSWHPRSAASRWAWLWLAVAGVAMVMVAGRHQALGWLGWALAILGWAQTVLGLRHVQHQRPAALPCRRGLPWLHGLQSVMAAPLLAFTVAAVAADPTHWPQRWPLAVALLLVAAWPACKPFATQPPHAQVVTDRPAPAMAQVATLLMMGSLPLMGEWCLANGQSVLLGTGLHLWAMAWASGFTKALLAHSPRLPLRTLHGLSHLLLAHAALLAWLGSALWHMVVTMALLSAAAAVWQTLERTPPPTSTHTPSPTAALSALARAGAWASQSAALLTTQLAGPLALLWLGHTARTQGPQALAWALTTLALLSLLSLLAHLPGPNPLRRSPRPRLLARARPAAGPAPLQPQPNVTP